MPSWSNKDYKSELENRSTMTKADLVKAIRERE
jgi:hypothetical protein